MDTHKIKKKESECECVCVKEIKKERVKMAVKDVTTDEVQR